MQTLEREILAEARITLNNRQLQMGNLLEWSTSQETIRCGLRNGEMMLKLPGGIWIAVSRMADKRKVGPCTCKADAAAVACANERQGSCRGFKAAEAVEKGVGDDAV